MQLRQLALETLLPFYAPPPMIASSADVDLVVPVPVVSLLGRPEAVPYTDLGQLGVHSQVWLAVGMGCSGSGLVVRRALPRSPQEHLRYALVHHGLAQRC